VRNPLQSYHEVADIVGEAESRVSSVPGIFEELVETTRDGEEFMLATIMERGVHVDDEGVPSIRFRSEDNDRRLAPMVTVEASTVKADWTRNITIADKTIKLTTKLKAKKGKKQVDVQKARSYVGVRKLTWRMQLFRYLDNRSTKGIKTKSAAQLEVKANQFEAGVVWVKKHKPKAEVEGTKKAVKESVKGEKTKSAKGKGVTGKKKGTSKTVKATIEESAEELESEA
jgi:hypothetical protein